MSYLLIKSPSCQLPHLADSLYTAASLTTKGGDIPLPGHFPKHALSGDYKLNGLDRESLTIPSAGGPPFYKWKDSANKRAYSVHSFSLPLTVAWLALLNPCFLGFLITVTWNYKQNKVLSPSLRLLSVKTLYKTNRD